MAITVSSGTYDLNDGTVSAPAIAFTSEPGTGFYSLGTGKVGITRNGTLLATLFPATFALRWAGIVQPINDNSLSFGNSSAFWKTCWSQNTTIQTSHSDYKREIQDIPLTVDIPRGISFYWNDETIDTRKQLGFLADDLPREAFVWNEDGTINKKGVYDSSVIGILCAHVRDLQARVISLKQELATLQGA